MSFLPSVTHFAQGIDPTITRLVLGEFEFMEFEVPERITIAARQRTVQHQLIGGRRIIDVLGTEYDPLSWAGIITGSQASERVCALERMRDAGLPLVLTLDDYRFSVVITAFSPVYEFVWRRPYTIEVAVNRLIEAIQIAPDVGPLAEKLHALNKEINVAEARLHALKTRAKKITGENIVRLDLGSTKERELCRDFIGRRFEKIIMYTANGTCDIYLENGIRLMGFSLRKRMDPQSLISACEYLDDGTLYF